MALNLWIVDDSGGELWELADPTNPSTAVNRGPFPFGLASPQGITSHDESLLIVDTSSGELWELADPTNPSTAVNRGFFPSGLVSPRGITSHDESLWIVDDSGDELWELADPTNPSTAVNRGPFPSGLASPRGITSHDESLWIVDTSGDELWELADPTNPSTAVNRGPFPSGLAFPRGITSHDESLWIVDTSGDELWELADPTNPSTAVNRGFFPSGLAFPRGITSHDADPTDPVLTIARDLSTVVEGTDATWAITADIAPSSDLTVNVDVTQSGTYIDGTAPTTVTLNSGSTSATLTVPTDDDSVDETDGSITATLETGTGYTLGSTTAATITVTDDDVPAVDLMPTFGTSTIADQTYTQNTPITNLSLPAATSGDTPLVYSLPSRPPGLNFNATTRVLSGTPTATGTTAMVFTVTDDDGDTDTIDFDITVTAVDDPTPTAPQTITIGAPTTSTASTLEWAGSVGEIGADFIADPDISTIYIRSFRINNFTGSLKYLWLLLNDTDDDSTPNLGPDLITSWENYEQAITISAGSVSLTLSGPNHPSTLVDDDREPYYWYYGVGDQFDAITSFVTSYNALTTAEKNATTFTIRDSVVTNTAPVITSPGTKTYDQGETITAFTVGITDADGDTLTISSSGLPSGLSLNTTTYQISGTVANDATVQAYTVTITANDGTVDTDLDFTINVNDNTPPTISNPGNKTYEQGETISAFSVTISDAESDSLTVTATGLPSGLSFNTTSYQFSGTVNSNATIRDYTVTITASDNINTQTTRTFTITVNAPPDLIPTFGSESVADQSYTQNTAITALQLPVATGGDGTLVYSTSALPAGLSFTASTRRITGTPTAITAATTITYTVTDDDGDTDTIDFDITVNAPADLQPTFGAETIADQSYTQNTAIAALQLPSATGGDTPLAYEISGQPAGVTLNASRQLVGTPTATGTFSVTFTVTDDDGDTDTLEFDITVNAPDLMPSLPSIADQTATVGTAFALTFTAASGGDTPLAYSVSGNPAWLTLSNRTLSGTPTGTGTHTVTITVTDDDGDTDTSTFDIVVSAAPAAITIDSIPDKTGEVVRALITAGASEKWYSRQGSENIGSLSSDSDVEIASDLIISRIWNVKVSDVFRMNDEGAGHFGDTFSAGGAGADATIYFVTPYGDVELPMSSLHTAIGANYLNHSLTAAERTILDQVGVDDLVNFVIAGFVSPDLMPDFGTETVANQTYTRNVAIPTLQLPSATGGDTPLAYSISGQPAGVTLNASLQLVGTPTATGTFNATFTVTDDDGDTDTIDFTITVNAADLMPTLPSIADQAATVGIAFSLTVDAATGGDAPLAYTVSGEPSWMSISGRTLSGTPDAAATSTIIVTVTDDDGDIDTASFDLVVSSAAVPQITITADQASVVEGTNVTFTVTTSIAPSTNLNIHIVVTEAGDVIDVTPPASVTILSGATTATLTVTTDDDAVDEVNGSVTATIQTGTGYTLGSASAATTAVTDNDDPVVVTPELTIGRDLSTVVEGTAVTFTLTADVAPESDLTVNVAVTQSGSYIDGTPPSTVTLSSGDTTATLTVSTDDDSSDETDGSITATLETGTGYTLGSTVAATIAVTDDDASAGISATTRLDAFSLSGRQPTYAIEIAHPDVTDNIRVIADTQDAEIEGNTYTALAFRARLPQQREGEVLAASVEVDNIGREMTQWVEASGGGRGATMRVMEVGFDTSGTAEIVWEVSGLDVGQAQLTNESFSISLTDISAAQSNAVKLRHDASESPGLF